MSSVHNSVETVNAAATAIVTAESRVQPSTIQKRRWGSCWSIFWCFGSHKPNKRIGHAVLVPEPTPPTVEATVAENPSHSATMVLPFIAPPSSPASFLQSDPPSATQSPAGLLSLTALSINVYSPGGTAPIFAVGPYAYETQLVSPPVFSAFTTEPSTACFTPPPESVQMTTPSSPEVPFAQLLTSSLARNRRNSGTNMKFSLSQYDFQPYQYPGSPGGNLKSPGSAISTSGTSSPFPDKLHVVEFRKGEAPKFLGYDHFANRKLGSRVGSGSLTSTGWGSRLGSGNVTPNGGLSRLGSGTVTPNGGLSRLGSGTVTPNGGEPPSQDSYLLPGQISEVASLANSDKEPKDGEVVVDYRVSFELIGEDIPTCVIKELVPSHRTALQTVTETNQNDLMAKNTDCCREYSDGETVNEVPDMARRHRTISLGSTKDFNFNNAKEEVLGKSAIDCEWWTNDKVPKKELGPRKDWTFFPMLQPGIS